MLKAVMALKFTLMKRNWDSTFNFNSDLFYFHTIRTSLFT